ncbi:MAG TPA: sortase [Acidimicrobiales bacterium]|nr:sortase [Acidimicrobiales bacterium]
MVEELGHGEGHAGVQVDWSAVLADVDSADLAAIIGRTVLGECGMGTAATTAASSAAGEGIEAAVPLAPNAGPALRRHLLRPLPIPVPGGRTRLRTWLAVGRRRARLATGFAWVQNIGALLILFAGWQVFGTSISEHHAQSALATAFSAKSSHARPPVLSGGGISLVPATTRLPEPPQGTVMARLEIPAIGLDQYVVSGTEPADLAKGPGHYPGSALPGQAGNVAIAGHRTTFGAPFFHLNDLQPGASIFLLTPSGEKLDYVVAGRPTSVSPDDTSILGDYGDNRLTLTTCTPPYSATQRLVVVAALRLPGVPLALERLSHDAPTPYRITTPTTSGWGWHSLPLALVVAAVLVGLGIGHRRLTNMLGKGMRWLVLVPIWAAGVYLLFETLTSLLPNTV